MKTTLQTINENKTDSERLTVWENTILSAKSYEESFGRLDMNIYIQWGSNNEIGFLEMDEIFEEITSNRKVRRKSKLVSCRDGNLMFEFVYTNQPNESPCIVIRDYRKESKLEELNASYYNSGTFNSLHRIQVMGLPY